MVPVRDDGLQNGCGDTSRGRFESYHTLLFFKSEAEKLIIIQVVVTQQSNRIITL